MKINFNKIAETPFGKNQKTKDKKQQNKTSSFYTPVYIERLSGGQEALSVQNAAQHILKSKKPAEQ